MKRIHAVASATLTLLLIVTACDEDPFGVGGWKSVSRDGFDFEWKVDGDDLQVELTGPTTGWVLVGFKSQYQLHDANVIIGYVSGSAASVRDDFGIDSDTHVSDSNLSGGTQNVTAISGEESSGSTTILFTIPLDSGDVWDNVLTEGESTRLVFARGANSADNFDSDWTHITSVTVTL